MNSPTEISDLKGFLDEKVDRYNRSNFIESDPIQIPHLYQQKEDIEIVAFIVATISWGQRKTIINNGIKLSQYLGESPYGFVMEANSKQISGLSDFKHRTFQGQDLQFFISSLRSIYAQHNGMEKLFAIGDTIAEGISAFRTAFLETHHEKRSEKHLSNPLTGSATKRINMFLRWMVRQDNRGVDFGIWKSISPSRLMLPLDVHTGNVSRELKLLHRTQDDWKAVEEVTAQLRLLDSNDPVKYDYALFALGVFEGFGKQTT
ncbi:MAG: TIGR02757 family protein [Flavobacteriales bacterium]|nr:TIGR02757 family protein [Flavobacteriales bacterium]